RLGGIAVAEVGLEAVCGRVAVGIADALERPLRRVMARPEVNGDGRAFTGGLDRDLGTDPAAAARDEDDAISQRNDHQDAASARMNGRVTGAVGGGAVEARSTSSVGSVSNGTSAPVSTPPACAYPRRPSSRRGKRTVERAGAVIAVIAMSSKPATETSPGI